MRSALIILLLLLVTRTLSAQVSADFSIPAQACMNQNIVPDNQSANATRYEWDLCQGDLTLTTVAENAKTLGGAVTTGVDMIFDGTNWFGFVTSQNTNSIKRLDFGNSIYSTPVVTDLGNIDSKINAPTDIKVVSENDNWYAFVYNLADPMISRIDLGTSLNNPSPTATAVVSGSGTVNGGFDIMYDGTKWNIVLTRNSAVTMVRLPSITGTPAGSDMISDVPNPFGTALGDIVLKKQGSNYYGFVTAWGNKTLQQLSFGTDLFSTPGITDLNVPGLTAITPYGIDMGTDNGHHYLFVSSLEGKPMRIDLGTDLSSISISASLLNLIGIENTLKIRLIKHQSNWIALAPSWSSTNLYRIIFTASVCSDFPTVLTSPGPTVAFQSAGTKYITLRAFTSNGWFSEVTKSINITTDLSPGIDFTVDGICVNFSSNFTAQGTGIQTYMWDFGDATSAPGSTTSHTYSSNGDYDVSLTVTAANTCTNFISRTISVYDKPVASFTMPAGFCTNNEITIASTTNDIFNGNLSYEWLVNGSSVSTERDLQYAFVTPGDNQVELTTSIPGCSDAVTHTATGLLVGPTAAFIFTGQCENDEVSFTNQSSGSIAGYTWTFGDTGTSTSVDPKHTFSARGVYTVTLNTKAPNGCISTSKHDLTIYTSPDPSFSLDLPPFSCSGTPSQFHDVTAALPDSNIDTWDWTFGDSGLGAGEDPVHTYVNAGNFNVGLTVTTDKGCTGSATQQVAITQSPAASFDTDPACVNKSTKLKDTSTGNVVGWQWRIGSAVYTSQNVQHTFTVPGNYSVQLSATGQNSCTNTITKPLIVPVVPTVAFDVENPCAGQAAVFTDVTSSAADPVSHQNWTFDNDANATGPSVEFQFDVAGTYSAQLQVKTQSGCVYSGSRQVTIFQSPVASFTTSDESGPPPLDVEFTNTSSGAVSYRWDFDDGSDTSTDGSAVHTFTAFGDYSVNLTATNNNGCSTVSIKNISVVAPENELALEDLTLLPTEPGGPLRGYIRVRNNGNYRIDNFVVRYDVGGGVQLSEDVNASIEKGDAVTIALSGEFTNPGQSAYVCVELVPDQDLTDNKACATFDNIAIILHSYPNPTDSYLTVESILSAPGAVRVRLYSSSGGLAYDRSFDAAIGLSRLSLDVQNLSPGIYVTIVDAGGTTSSQRILIAR